VKRTIVIAAALLAVIAAGAGTYAYAASSSDGTTINGCVGTSDGKLRVLSASDTCKSNETALSWNSVGPAGAQGPAGAAGAAGAQGLQGPAGRDGRDSTASNPDATDATMTVTSSQGAFSDSPMVLTGLSHEIVAPQSVSGGGGATGKVVHKPLNVTKLMDASSPKLMTALLNNAHVTVLIALMQGGQQVGTTKLTNASISDYVLHGNTETWSFVYQKIEWTFGANSATDDQSPA
jgi:type VI secretion system Hcp family effector